MELNDIKKLANLARIDMTDEEMEGIAHDFDPILKYVGQVKDALKSNENIPKDKHHDDYFLHNVMREDIVTNTPNQYTKKILDNAPETQDGYLKVKQIL